MEHNEALCTPEVITLQCSWPSIQTAEIQPTKGRHVLQSYVIRVFHVVVKEIDNRDMMMSTTGMIIISHYTF